VKRRGDSEGTRRKGTITEARGWIPNDVGKEDAFLSGWGGNGVTEAEEGKTFGTKVKRREEYCSP